MSVQDTSETEWNDHRIWKVICSYPDSLRTKFEQLKEGLNIYIDEGYSAELFEKYHISRIFWKSFYHQISKNNSVELGFIKSKGFKSDLGLEWCKYKIKLYYQKCDRIPPCGKNLLFSAMKYVCLKKKVFAEYSILTWNDLLKEALPDIKIRTLKKKEGLNRVRRMFQNYYDQKGTVPSHTQTGFPMILTAINRGNWTEYGITSWNGLLCYVFEPAKGYTGLQTAIKELQLFYKEHKRVPAANYVGHIYRGIKLKYWTEFGIRTWYDLLRSAFNPKLE